MKLYLSLLWITLIFVQASIGQEWKNIIPLKSTRAEVEKAFAQSADKNCATCTYSLPIADLIVEYSLDTCRGRIPGWNVAADTVLSFSVIPKQTTTFDISKIDKKKWFFGGFDDLTGFYADPVKGIKYSLSPEAKIESIYYAPSVQDNKLRCKGFPPYNLAGASFPSTDTYVNTDIEYGKTAMRSYLNDLSLENKLSVIIYSGEIYPLKSIKTTSRK